MPMPANLSPRFQNRTYAAFLFDMDVTMPDSSAVVERTWRAWANRHGINPDDLLESVHGCGRRIQFGDLVRPASMSPRKRHASSRQNYRMLKAWSRSQVMSAPRMTKAT